MHNEKLAQALADVCALRRGSRERTVETHLNNLFAAFGLAPELDQPIGGGFIDILLPECRVVVEAKSRANPKAPGSPRGKDPEKAKRSQFEQLEAYIQALRAAPQGASGAGKSCPWIGILADGTVWYAWKWPAAAGDAGDPVSLPGLPDTSQGQEGVLQGWLEAHLYRKEAKGLRRWIPREISRVFPKGEQDTLRKIYDACVSPEGHPGRRAKASVWNKREIWLDLLRGSGLAPAESEGEYEIPKLFIRHTYLVVISRAAIGALTETTEDDDPQTTLKDGFVSWVLDAPGGLAWARRIYKTAFAYDWRARAQDVLRKFYASVISKEQRKLYGEYYTPDWVAQMLAERVLDDTWLQDSIQAALADQDLSGIGVLDPACGSGTFLFHAARRILAAPALQGCSPKRQADVVARLVHGIDIHPVAVEMARATLLRALPAEPTHGPAALHVAQGDSLLASGGADEMYSGEIRLPSEGNPLLVIPRDFVLEDDYRRRTAQLVEAARDGQAEAPVDALDGLDAKLASKMQEAYQELLGLCKKRGNGIWTWLIVNAVAPLRLQARKVNRILANPPWVRMSEIQVKERKRELEEMFKHEKLWVGGKAATGTDIASLFVKRCRNAYLEITGGVSAWVLNHASIQGLNWAKFRTWMEAGNTEVIDFREVKAPPFAGAHSCAWVERNPRTSGETQAAQLRMRPGQTVAKDCQEPWVQVREKAQLYKATRIPTGVSGYMEGTKCVFRNGATIFPHCLVRVEELTLKGDRADFKTRASTKGAWKDLDAQEGTVPKSWIVDTVYPVDLLPFCLRKAISKTILPLHPQGHFLEDLPEEDYWKKAEDLYQDYAGRGSNTPQTLLGNIDFSSKLSKQLPLQTSKPVVVYNASGQYLCAAVCKGKTVVEHGVYYLPTKTPQEAEYLAALLNADALQPAFQQARKSDRHFDTHFWREVPIPQFDPKDPLHQKLADLGAQAAKVAVDYRDAADPKGVSGPLTLRTHIRKHLRADGLADQIDMAASLLLPKQVGG